MDLPLDHFRLLGVSPTADAQQVLRTLAQRLDRIPHPGFTAETLRAREELLRDSADLLSDEPTRTAYEAELMSLEGNDEALSPALDIPSSKELGGLLLLYEAGQPQECFEFTAALLQPPQAPALGSGREADLTLLAGLAAAAAAAELRDQRHYERAAGILQQGLQLLQRMGQWPDLREDLHRDLDRLTPYRVLDLLSRDLAASQERSLGLTLLEQLVQRRGGLEGQGDPDFPFSEFQAFFRQIRSYLTVQEQVDLFTRWAETGSEAADFLATTALAASGFAQRKPDRILAARERLAARDDKGVEPLLANLHLLLGDVEGAKARFAAGADSELKAWAARFGDDPLAQVCAYCRDWLMRDVLPGYRDLDAEPDLEAYFSDRDVLAFIDRQDRGEDRATVRSGSQASQPHGRGGPAAGPSPLDPSSLGTGWLSDQPFPTGLGTGFTAGAGLAPIAAPPAEQEEPDEEEDEDVPLGRFPRRLGRPRGATLAAVLAAILLAALGGTWLLRQRRPATPSPPPREEAAAGRSTDAGAEPAGSPSAAAPQPTPAVQLPLTASEPGEAELRGLLQAWLQAKAAVLAGGEVPEDLDRLARPRPIERLRRERRTDAARGETQKIEVKVLDLSVRERSPIRIAALAELDYRDERRNAEGEVIERFGPSRLRNVYVFGRDDGRWRVVAVSPAG